MSGYVIEKKEQLNLRWNHFESNLSGGLLELMEEKAFVDVTIGCENQFVQAHKNILSVCSPYFKSLFNANPCKHPIVILKDVRLTELKALLQFMYRGEVCVSEEDVPGLLRTADALNIKGLANMNKNLLTKTNVVQATSSDCTNINTSTRADPPARKRPRTLVTSPCHIDVDNIEGLCDIKMEPETLELLDIDPVSDASPCSHRDSVAPVSGASNGIAASQSTQNSTNVNGHASEERLMSILEAQRRQMEEISGQQGVFSQLLQQVTTQMASQGAHAIVQPVQAIPPGTYHGNAFGTQHVNIVNPESTVRLVGSEIEIPGVTFNSFNRSKYSLFVNDLSIYLFGIETLRKSSLTGKPSRLTRSDRIKAQLDPTKVAAIINQTRHEYPGITESQIRQAIRAKCNNLNNINAPGRDESWQSMPGPYSTDDEATCD